ncbi:aftiphilin-like isoform X2 [Anguilla anguilla]|uniref:aftiphilin-like isoform X2 n=1 Tax=Anguilla anguilla TaxID=7936 RepID=UPI0015AF2D9F|nr:aftiphilin-like isoform X2 [Anguilla anguilla]
MEPDVIRMYSSSPPPLDDAPEEEDEEFGDFGGFSGVASSVSFGEFDSPKGFGQSRAADTSPPGRSGGTVAAGFAPGGPGRGPGAAQLRSDPRDPGCSHASPLPERMFGSEAVRKPAPGAQAASGGRAESRARDCNRDVPAAEGFNNGFGPFDAEEAPVVRPKKRGPAAKPTLDCCGHRPVTSSTPAGPPRICSLGSDGPLHASGAPGGTSLGGMVSEPRSGTALVETSMEKNGLEDSVGRTGSPTPTMAPLADLNDREWGESERGNPEPRTELPSALREQSPASLNGAEEGGAEVGGAEDECAVGPGTVSASVSDDFASFCQAVSPDGLEDFGDFNATGFAAPPFLEGEEPPANRTNEEGSSGDFGQTETLDRVADLAARPTTESTEEGEFGGSEDGESVKKEGEEDQGEFAGFPGSDSFADFSSAPTGAEPDSPAGWSAFEQPEDAAPAGGSSWAAFQAEQGAVLGGENEETSWDDAATAPPSGCPRTCRRDSLTASLASRLERLFRVSFPAVGEPEAGGEVPSLKALLEPPDARLEPGEERSSASHSTGPRDVWWRLQDIHDAFGLRYQWGGSHSNRALLCSLGIDNRSILFTGQKKQPVIVPAYAASLGMLEPTKDPASPLSAAEKTASIAQAPSTSLEISTSPDSTQEALLPIQFDWSSSGLTNPLDGKLTTAKLETSNTSSLPDSFAHPISAVGKTCSSSRKHRQEGALSEEAARVMAALPDLSFMLARVVMFPVAVT